MGGISRRPARAAGLLLSLLALTAAACGSSSSSSQAPAPSSATSAQPTSGRPSYEGVPLESGPSLASASSTAPGIAVDGIHCLGREQLAYHIHAHLQVYVDGQPRSLPGGIGLVRPVAEPTAYGPAYAATKCYYWLHTHAADGVIHIESPAERIYTLGQFFDEWGQPLSSHSVAEAHGAVSTFVNGQRVNGNPRSIPLLPHAVIQLDVGPPVVPFQAISFAGTGL